MLKRHFKLLVADSSPMVSRVIRQGVDLLNGEHLVDILSADNSQEVQAHLARQAPDLCFLDLQLPGISGELLANMSKAMGRRSMFVPMAASINDSQKSVLAARNAYHFLQKPFRSEKIDAILRACCRMNEETPVLLVDDSATTRKLVRNVLENCRFNLKVFEAASGQEALRMLNARKFSLVLTDFNMPGMDGVELAGRIAELTSKVSVYMMSTKQSFQVERSAAFVGVAGFLKKPFGPEDIDVIVHQALGMKKPSFAKERSMFRFEAA